MEDDDFGFTLRDDKVLRKVLTSRTTVGKEELKAGEVEGQRAQLQCSKEAALKNTPDSNGGFIPALVPVPSKGTKGVVKGGATSPETGSNPLNIEQRTKASVARDTPNIPNVVEYHLKVKPQTQKDIVTYQVSVNIYDTHRIYSPHEILQSLFNLPHLPLISILCFSIC